MGQSKKTTESKKPSNQGTSTSDVLTYVKKYSDTLLQFLVDAKKKESKGDGRTTTPSPIPMPPHKNCRCVLFPSTPKHLVHTARRIKKGEFLSGHCGGGRDKKAPSDGYVLAFSTANSTKEAADANTTDEVFLPASLLASVAIARATKKR